MRVNGFQCDKCTKIGDDNKVKGWFFVRFHETNSGYKEQHFCSPYCLHDWIEKQISVVKEVKVEGFGGSMPVVNWAQKDEHWSDL